MLESSRDIISSDHSFSVTKDAKEYFGTYILILLRASCLILFTRVVSKVRQTKVQK